MSTSYSSSSQTLKKKMHSHVKTSLSTSLTLSLSRSPMSLPYSLLSSIFPPVRLKLKTVLPSAQLTSALCGVCSSMLVHSDTGQMATLFPCPSKGSCKVSSSNEHLNWSWDSAKVWSGWITPTLCWASSQCHSCYPSQWTPGPPGQVSSSPGSTLWRWDGPAGTPALISGCYSEIKYHANFTCFYFPFLSNITY